MSTNEGLARVLEEIAQMMDLLGEDSFRASAHARASRLFTDLPRDVAEMSREELLALDGVGPKLADKVLEYTQTGRIAELDALRAKVPPGLLALLGIPGLGPKTVRMMWTQGGITDLPALRRAIADGTLEKLPRMGAKSVEKIKASLEFAQVSAARVWLGQAWAVANRFLERLTTLPGVTRVEPAGSLRRGKETIGDVDLLVCLAHGHDAAIVAQRFIETPGVVQVLAHGHTKCSVRSAIELNHGRWSKDPDPSKGETVVALPPSIQVDLRILPPESFGSGLNYFTGSKEHNVRLRERALSMGMTLNEYGLFRETPGETTPPQSRGERPIASVHEEDIYRALKLPWIPPEAREDRGEFDHAEPWRLVELADIRAELHAHTTASDGALSIEELAREAKSRGFHTIAVTDHSRSSAIAGGLSVERLIAHIDAVHAARARVPGITILAGSEVDILADGTLDYPDDILAQLDIVVASPHVALTQDPASATSRLLDAIAHPRVHILGHPTGRLINRRPGLSPDMPRLYDAARTRGVALEINAHWMRLDLRDTHVRAARDAGCLLAINCDVHAREDFDNLRFGVVTARRGWLTPDRCINTWDAATLHAWLKRPRTAAPASTSAASLPAIPSGAPSKTRATATSRARKPRPDPH